MAIDGRNIKFHDILDSQSLIPVSYIILAEAVPSQIIHYFFNMLLLKGTFILVTFIGICHHES